MCICREGFSRNSTTGECEDIDECSDNENPVCGAHAFCKNLLGNYDCQCPEGYIGNPFVSCQGMCICMK